ncbi:glycogenin-1-like isoform X2 [Maniola jurtina]|uniref:glycogenin-1-like isoform X2 n=1 Tax=Maniola jurtina TaxID=191418 RepID=UPI001E686DDF|nr:glycogenin-1-like isoform X2 [Maniola jurtina]
MSNRAWVTLATNDSYSLGALVVAHSLRRSGSIYPAVVLITPSVTEAMRERLRAVFAEVVVVDVLDSRDAAHLALLRRPELGVTFTKIHCWNLTQYEKCVFLDADTLIVQNCDELFEREELSAAPDVGWPDCFNSGVFVFRPSAETFSNLITFASERGSFDGGDQGLLNSYFSNWAQSDISKHLPFLYNVTSAAFYSYIPALKHYGQNLKIIHFIGAAKPWLQHFNWQSRSVDAPEHLREFLQLWWDLFVGQVHSQLDTTMDMVVEDFLEIPQEETINYNEPTVNYSYYEPSLDSHSEFPWHHPDNQVVDPELNVPEIDMNEFHNPWDIYRGNIPAFVADTIQNEQKADDHHEIRKYAWDYHPQQYQNQTESHNYEQMVHSKEHNVQHHHDDHTSKHKEDVWQSNHESSPNDNLINVNVDIPHSDYYHHQQHETNHQLHAQDYHHNASQYHENKPHEHLSPSDQHIQEYNYTEPHHTHEYHYDHVSKPEDNNNIFNQTQNNESHVDSHVCHEHSLQDHEHHVGKKLNGFTFSSQFEKQNRPQVYTVMMDHVKVKKVNHHIPEEKMNGYVSDDDSDIYGEITPRHPYDGFYLRHRMTIDSRGRKICSHEIPVRSPSPPSESSEEFEDALETLPEEITEKALNGEDSQTGVAGNLARVVPGAPLQQEAVDELTRRQGWETGNIDYMGADSFDNILAKISQTLSQPPSSEQPEPSKEESQPEVAADPPSAPAPAEPASEPEPVASEPMLVETPSEKPVEAPVEKEVAVPEKVEVAPSEIAPVEVPEPIEKSPEAEVVPTVEAAKPVEEAPVAAVPVPADEAPALAETTEAAEPTPAPSEAAKPTETAKLEAASDSPPLANTPSKEEIPETPAAKSEERRKPAGKLQLRPPLVADPALTPDSEAEDAAALAQSIIASELRTPTVTEPTPPALSPSAAPPAADSRLSVQEPTVPSPPVGAVSLSQIGIKSKPTTAALIESSVKTDSAPSTPESPKPADAPKKKIVKKVIKKDKEGSSSGEAPVPPPRKKEKKPKEK